MRLLVFDTETTGFLRKPRSNLAIQPELVEFAGAIIQTSAPEAEPEWLEFRCRPRGRLPARIEALLQMKDAELNCEAPFAAHYAGLATFIGSAEGWCAHNLAFDTDMLKVELARIRRLKSFPFPTFDLCTMKLSRKLFFSGRHALRDLHWRMCRGEALQTHKARDDVEMLLAILRSFGSEKLEGFLEPSSSPSP